MIGVSDIAPFSSLEQGGLFMIFADKQAKTYKYADAEGKVFKRVYGPRSAPFRNNCARVHIIDEEVDEQQLNKVGSREAALFTFMKKLKNGHYALMKIRLSQASFMDDIGLARVVILGEEHIAYIGMDGKPLPYRFKSGDEVSRDGEINVKFLDGKSGVIVKGGFVYKIEKGQRVPATEYENILTLEDLQKAESAQN